MTSSYEPALLIITAPVPGTRVQVLDSSLGVMHDGVVHHRFGYSHADLAPGVYQIEAQLGGVTSTQLVMLPPGAEVRRNLRVEFPAAAPVKGTSTSFENHGYLAHDLSEEVAHGVGPDSGLVLMLRNLRGFEEGHLATNGVTMYDQRLQKASQWNADWTISRNAAARCGRFPPGPYLLRTQRRTETEGLESTDQTIWLSEGWQTVVFVPNGPSGPDSRGASIHMVPLTEPWSQDDQNALAVEAALVALRDGGRSPELGLHRLGYQLSNPMLGIVGLHQLRQRRPDPRYRTLAPLRDQLRSLVGNHPDVLALQSSYSDARDAAPVDWPPMLDTSYRNCLLPADSRVMPEGSPAERVAPFLRPSPLWLQWPSTSTPDIVLAYPEIPALFTRPPDVAVDRVEAVLRDIGDFKGLGPNDVVEKLGSTELARRSGMPRTLVQAALREMGMGSRLSV